MAATLLPLSATAAGGSTLHLAELDGVSCVSASRCVAVGRQGTSDSVLYNLVAATYTGSGWTVATLPQLPGPDAPVLQGVSCPSTTFCVAVGGESIAEPMAEVLHGSTWTAVALPTPSGAQYTFLNGISCTSATFCVAAGTLFPQGNFVETYDGTRWVVSSGPGGAGVSCAAPGTCVAVGGSTISTVKAGVWTTAPAPIPGGQPYSYLDGVDCTSATRCTAVGSYGSDPNDASNSVWGLHLSGGHWAADTPIPEADPGHLYAVSCTDALCRAAGGLTGGDALVATRTGGAWKVTPGLDVAGATGGALQGISCATATTCVAVGTDNQVSGNTVAAAAILAHGKWRPVTVNL